MSNDITEKIKVNHSELINKAKILMASITDNEHNISHMNDVVKYATMLVENIKKTDGAYGFNKEACLIAAYWHDVGRSVQAEGHEKISADMLKEEMIKLKYSEQMIELCYNAIIYHKWNMQPLTLEGKVVKDADKLAWLGLGRWSACIDNNRNLDVIINLLPKLKNEILYFSYSKTIYDTEIVNLTAFLYDTIFDKVA